MCLRGGDFMSNNYIPASPYAKKIAKEKVVDIRKAIPTGFYGEVIARDVLGIATQGNLATHLARRTAEFYDVDLNDIKGAGHGGKVRKEDVLAFLEGQNAGGTANATIGGRREKLTGMRRIVSQRMLKSHLEIPPVTHTVKNDVTALLEARSKINAQGKRKYSINDFVIKAVAKALEVSPFMLVSIEDDDIIYHSQVNLGMAVAIEAGLVVPVIKNAQAMSFDELSDAARDMAVRARDNKLTPDEFSGNNFTVSNLGMYDVESFTPIINQPDAAILGVCSIFDELALVNGTVTLKKIMRTSLTYDHRILDGANAAKFQKEIKRLLENPIEIVM